jgi:hypothetical protein
MKFLLFPAFLFFFTTGLSQNFQLHYDFRHTIDPRLNPDNFPAFSFEYFRNIDTTGTGSFLLKVQTDLKGKNKNPGQVFIQVSQSLKFWKPKIYLAFSYSGGLGLTQELYGYYLPNSVGAGVSCPFQWKGTWIATNLVFRYTAFDKPSWDPQFTFYFGKGFFNYKIFVSGSFVFWTQNKNQGNAYTENLSGKKFAFFGDPQVWIRIKNGFSIGSRISTFYNLITADQDIRFYPTIGTRYQF